NSAAAQHGPTNGEGSVKSAVHPFWDYDRHKAGETRDFSLPQTTMLAVERYGTRTPSEREHRIIQLVAEGLKNKEVADAIGTTEQVVKNYLRVIYDKLRLCNRLALAL